MTTKVHLPTSRSSSQSSKDERYNEADKPKNSYESLDASPIDGILRRLRHTPLFTQIGSIMTIGALAVYFIIIGSGAWLDGSWFRGCGLLLFGLLRWCAGIVLCMAFAKDQQKPQHNYETSFNCPHISEVRRQHFGLYCFAVPGVEVHQRLPVGVADDIAAGHLIGTPRYGEGAISSLTFACGNEGGFRTR
jgi:hypothetical protein